MTQPAVDVNGSVVLAGENGLPVYMDVPLAGSSAAQAGRNQYLTLDPATGFADLGDDATPNQISAGVVRVSEVTDFNATGGLARARVQQGFSVHSAPSTIASDTPGSADVAKPIWLAPSNAPGLLSHTGTVAGANLKNRSLLGLALGKVKEGASAIYQWVGPIAQAVARGVMMADAALLGSYAIADASASTTTAERAITRAPWHGPVTSITFEGAAVAADASDTATITIAKRDGAGGGATTLGTYATTTGSNGAITAFVPAAFTLSSTATDLDILETDIITITVAKGSSGKVLTGVVRVNGKVI